MARPKILIERGRLVLTEPGGKKMILGAETSKSHPGRIDVHMGNGLIGHMTYDQAWAEFKKEGVGVEAFEQAFSRLKKNGSDVCVYVASDSRHNAEFIRLDKAAQYVQRLIKAGFSPGDISVERDGIELDIVEDLGMNLKKNSKLHRGGVPGRYFVRRVNGNEPPSIHNTKMSIKDAEHYAKEMSALNPGIKFEIIDLDED